MDNRLYRSIKSDKNAILTTPLDPRLRKQQQQVQIYPINVSMDTGALLKYMLEYQQLTNPTPQQYKQLLRAFKVRNQIDKMPISLLLDSPLANGRTI